MHAQQEAARGPGFGQGAISQVKKKAIKTIADIIRTVKIARGLEIS